MRAHARARARRRAGCACAALRAAQKCAPSCAPACSPRPARERARDRAAAHGGNGAATAVCSRAAVDACARRDAAQRNARSNRAALQLRLPAFCWCACTVTVRPFWAGGAAHPAARRDVGWRRRRPLPFACTGPRAGARCEISFSCTLCTQFERSGRGGARGCRCRGRGCGCDGASSPLLAPRRPACARPAVRGLLSLACPFLI